MRVQRAYVSNGRYEEENVMDDKGASAAQNHQLH